MPNLSSLVNPNSAVITNTDANPASVRLSNTDDSIAEIAYYLSKLVKMSEALAVVDTAQRQRVVSEVTSIAANQVITVRGENNTAVYQGGVNSFSTFYAIADVWKIVDAARQNYQTSIRSNLQFS
jgi:hypothetical protein